MSDEDSFMVEGNVEMINFLDHERGRDISIEDFEEFTKKRAVNITIFGIVISEDEHKIHIANSFTHNPHNAEGIREDIEMDFRTVVKGPGVTRKVLAKDVHLLLKNNPEGKK